MQESPLHPLLFSDAAAQEMNVEAISVTPTLNFNR